MLQVVRAYTRVSTDEQVEEGFSIAAQREAVQKFCESQRWTIAEWYVEEGESAKDLVRPQLSRLRSDLRPGEIVVVYRLDRLTRSVLDLHNLLQEWDKGRTAFRSVTEPYDTTTAMGRLFITLVAALAQWERENLAERVKFGMTQMVKEGKWYGGFLPFGYQYDQAAGRLVPHPEQAPWVRQIFRWYGEGKGTRAIAIELNNTGMRTNQGSEWVGSTIYHILRSQVYQGHTVWNKKGKGDPVVVLNTHEPIVTEEMVAAVSSVALSHVDRHPREIASQYPLTGLARCGVCGGRVNGKTQPRYDKVTGERRWETRQYWCQARKNKKSCTLPAVSERTVETALFEQIRQLADRSRLEELAREDAAADPHEEERRLLESELQSISRRVRRWWDDYDAGDIPARIANQRTAQLEERSQEIRTRLAQISPGQTGVDVSVAAQTLDHLLTHWEAATVGERKALLGELFESITLFPGGRVVPKLKPLRP